MTSKTTNKFSPEVRARAVRMVLEYLEADTASVRVGSVVTGSLAARHVRKLAIC